VPARTPSYNQRARRSTDKFLLSSRRMTWPNLDFGFAGVVKYLPATMGSFPKGLAALHLPPQSEYKLFVGQVSLPLALNARGQMCHVIQGG
jgi:hypothetical protein